MSYIACGLNHETAPLDLRGELAYTDEHVASFLPDLLEGDSVSSAVILSTCNRTEFYCYGKASRDYFLNRISQHRRIPMVKLEPHFYFHQDENAVSHIIQVACGLKSLVLGEPQILGQMKDAFNLAMKLGGVDSFLDRLFQYVFSVTKRVRSDTAIGVNPVSVAFAAVHLAKKIFSRFDQCTAMLIGAGDTIKLVGRYIKDAGINNIIVANRTLETANVFANSLCGTGIRIGEIPEFLPKADLVITATASQLPILGKGSVERCIKIRKHKPIFMVDLAVPRDIEAEVSDLADVFLYTIDDLKDVIDENQKWREQAASEAEVMIETQTEHFMKLLRSLDSTDSIRYYREYTERIRDDILAKAMKELQQGHDPTQIMTKLARTLTNKVMHHPSVSLKQAYYDGDGIKLQILAEALGLKNK